ncbi:DJ-1/PfpI family protein [Evansella halocellulosilytica]|uniref:DJ-1/PfpI family protein n=1 Tax=Evansella halocellulosilytica TaxID=2011013 RepID=UPI000BB94273|nr:DJ-1/PfpI family protein [Evansella halocellulosilytica]
MNQYHVGILLFDGVDALDFAGPYEVFNLTTFSSDDVKKLFMNQLMPEQKPFIVSTVSEDGKTIEVHNGLKVEPDYSFHDAPSFDVVVIPGGPYEMIKAVSNNQTIISWIQDQKEESLVASVCTGALFLAKAGLLKGKKATTNRAALDLLERTYPDVQVIREVKYVDEGNVITAAGISSGMNMSLHIVKKLLNREAAERTAYTIEFEENI